MGLFKNLKSALGGAPRLDVESRFDIQHTSTAGTMSTFYRARDRQTGLVVGLKVLHPKELAAFEARFKGVSKPSEGAILKAIDHPRIVKLLEHGLTVKGEQYIVMEFIQGSNLNLLIAKKHPLLDGRRVEILRQMAEALRAVHLAGYIHRDVCPGNFMVSPDGASVKLIDFGLTIPATAEFMQPGNRTGKPNYMAPELIKRQPTDLRLDVFAYGVSAYELCTGELPWERGETGQAAMLHANSPAHDIFRRAPALNPRLGDAISRCIERERERRCQTMNEVLDMLKGVQSETADA